jgi:CheY-like chemotaxis protein
MDNSAPRPSATILFVDDDPAFLETVQAALGPLSGDQWKLQLVTQAEQALAFIRAQITDLVVVDVHMPGTGGLQLLQILHRDFPTLPKVLLTSLPDAATRLTALESGAALFLEKPASLAGMESLFATLNELVKWHHKQDPQRPRQQARLIEIVRLECASGNSRLIEVFIGDITGLIYVKSGSIMHAEAPGRRGQSAFTFLASHPEATFFLKEFSDPPERSITRQWEFLVLEAFQLREQLIQAAQEAKRKDTLAPSRPAPAPPTSPTRALKDIAAVTPGAKAAASPSVSPPEKLRLAPSGPKRMQPQPDAASPGAGVAPAAVPQIAESFSLQVAPASLSVGTSPASNSPHIEEMLVCNRQNEVLYEWRCTRTEVRFVLLDALFSKSQQISQTLPFGSPNRIEFQASDSRLAVRWRGETTMLIRSNSKQRAQPSSVPPFNRPAGEWLASHSHIQGLLACGLMRSNHTVISCSYLAELPSDTLNGLWRAIHEIMGLVHDQHLDPWLVRWIFDSAQLYWLRRLDGRALGLVLAIQPAELDTVPVQQVVQEFLALLEA